MISALSCRILSSNTEETWMCSEIHFCYFCNRSRGATNVNRAFGERCTELWRAFDLNTNSHPQQFFSISQLKVTNWQEGHVPRGHLTWRRSLCKSLQVILSSHKLCSESWHEAPWRWLVKRQADIRSAVWDVRGHPTRLKWPVFKLFYFKTIKLSFVSQVQMIRFPVFAYCHQSNSLTKHTNRWDIFPSVMLDN